MNEASQLFVYGTLRRDSGHPGHGIMADGAVFLGRGVVRGNLYRLGWHPGAVLLSDQQERWIQGELYRLHDAEQLLRVLDDYEGCGPNDPEPHRFARVAVEVRLDGGDRATAWIYVFRASTDGAALIESGDWLDAAS